MPLPLSRIFETHLAVTDRERSVSFYQQVLGLSEALTLPERDVTFLWIGQPREAMLGLWGQHSHSSPVSGCGHFAVQTTFEAIKQAPAILHQAKVLPLDMDKKPTDEPVVLCWVPAASIYFEDPDLNLIEFICILTDTPKPELGVITLTEWESKAYPQ